MFMDVGASMAAALSITQLFDSIGIRVKGEEAADVALSIDWTLTDLGESYRTELSNGAFVHWPTSGPGAEESDLALSLTKADLLGLLAGKHGLEGIEHTGDASALQQLVGVLDAPDSAFPIATP